MKKEFEFNIYKILAKNEMQFLEDNVFCAFDKIFPKNKIFYAGNLIADKRLKNFYRLCNLIYQFLFEHPILIDDLFEIFGRKNINILVKEILRAYACRYFVKNNISLKKLNSKKSVCYTPYPYLDLSSRFI